MKVRRQNKCDIKRETKFGTTYWRQRGEKHGRFLVRQNMLIWYLSELEAQEPRHISHGHGVEFSASFKAPCSLVFFMVSVNASLLIFTLSLRQFRALFSQIIEI